MGSFLGKINFNQGLTTQKKGQYGNYAMLNVCHGFDTSTGELTPINNVGSPISGHFTNYTENSDTVIEYKDSFYSYTDFLNELWTPTLSVKNFFGNPILLSKPCVSDGLIVYPTDKGLFAYEPTAQGGKRKCRYLSFMSPADYDYHEDTPTYELQASHNNVDKYQVFGDDTSDYVALGETNELPTITIESFEGYNNSVIKCEQTHTDTEGRWGFRVPFEFTDYVKSWFIYDLRIENDAQNYTVDRHFFENNDASPSGYEINFVNITNGTRTVLYTVGITKLQEVEDQWYRCASVIDFDASDMEQVTHVEFKVADYWYTDSSDYPTIYLGVQDKDTVDTKDQWRYVGNYIYPYGEAEKTSSYKDTFEIKKENYDTTPKEKNEFPDYNLEKEQLTFIPNDTGVEYGYRDWGSTYCTMSIQRHDGTTISKDYTRYVKINWNCGIEQVCQVSPLSTYKFGFFRLLGCDKAKPCKITFSDDNNASTVYVPFTNNNTRDIYSDEFTTGNNTALTINFQNIDDSGQDNRIGGFILVKVSSDIYYKTTKILYSFDKDDVFDDDKYIHNQQEFAYSYYGRNKYSTYSLGGSKDQWKLMISNSSEETERVADNPFATTTLSINTLPTKLINGVERNVKECYNDYWLGVALYKSTIYNTGVQTDFSFIGKIEKDWTAPDTSSDKRRFADNYFTTTGFVAKDNYPYDEDSEKDTYYNIDDWHALDPEQEIYNDFLEQANCVTHLNGRLFAGNIGRENGVDLQPTSLAVSNYDENWIFPTSVDEGSITGTGTQTDNLHNISNRIVAITSVRDRVFVFYDKEVLYLYGNDFYSSNGFGTTIFAKMNCLPQTIATSLREVIVSDGKDIYKFGVDGGIVNMTYNTSNRKIDVPNMNFTNASANYYDGKYYILCPNALYVCDMYHNFAWYTIDKQNIIQMIDYITEPMVVVKVNNTTYSVANLYGGDLSGKRIVETMYQILNSDNADYDVDVNDFATELESPTDNETLTIKMIGIGEFKEEWKKTLPIDTKHFRYNRKVRFNKAVSAIKQRIEYVGNNPPTIHSIGVVRNNAKKRE